MKIAVPDVQQTEPHRQVLFQRRRAEVFVHLVRAGQKFAEAIGANCDEVVLMPNAFAAAT